MADTSPTILVAGASRGLGLGLAGAFAARGWRVIGTVRGTARTDLHELAEAQPDAVAVEALDITDAAGLAALRARLAGRTLDMLFVNAGTTAADEHATAATVATDEFNRVMVTNALAPMRVVEALAPLVPADGLIGVMSSGQGSVANNEGGRRDVYRASKAALNTMMRCFAAREGADGRALVLLAPGWVRTDLGGPGAPFTLDEVVPMLADVLEAKRGRPGLAYLDRFGAPVPW